MKPSQAIRIALLLVVIFAAGVLTGRLTAPRQLALVRGADGRFATSETALAVLKRELQLNAAQEATFRPLLEEIANEMRSVPPATRERLELWRRYHPRMQALLRPEQYPHFERYVRDSEMRWERTMRRQNRTNF